MKLLKYITILLLINSSTASSKAPDIKSDVSNMLAQPDATSATILPQSLQEANFNIMHNAPITGGVFCNEWGDPTACDYGHADIIYNEPMTGGVFCNEWGDPTACNKWQQ